MNKNDKNLLLYLETCAVDYGGKVNLVHMNKEDRDIAKKWNDEKFISFGRIVFADCVITERLKAITHWVELSESAWKAAHDERRARATRLWAKRTWSKTSD